MSSNDYLFNLRISSLSPRIKTSNSQTDLINYDKPYDKTYDKIEGPTGPAGDRFCTKTIRKTCLTPAENSLLIFNVEPGLAYISGNSVIVVEVATSLASELNSFEGTIHYYGKESGQIFITDITNIKGEFGNKECMYYVNLDGVDGAPGEQGPPGPTGPSNISSTTISLQLYNDTIVIPHQFNTISYYTLNVDNLNELKNINCSLSNKQMAIILIKLNDVINNPNSVASIFPILSVNVNYNDIIKLNSETPFAIFTIYNIENLLFGDCKSYYKNNYYTNV
jgi:hypothetical protein